MTPTFDVSLSSAAVHLWQWFMHLHQGRQEGYAGPVPLSWGDMAAWAKMVAAEPRPAEWRIIRAMDEAYLSACHELAQRERQASQSADVRSERPMTPELWDAVFQ